MPHYIYYICICYVNFDILSFLTTLSASAILHNFYVSSRTYTHYSSYFRTDQIKNININIDPLLCSSIVPQLPATYERIPKIARH